MPAYLSASVLLSLALLLGRLTGLLRELRLAALFGVSPTADLAILLLTLPDLLLNLLLAGGIGAALVPRLSALAPEPAAALLRQASLGVLALFGLAGALLLAWPQAFFSLLAPGMAAPFAGAGWALAAVALAMPLTGAAGISAAYLNASQRFMVAGCGTLLFNLAVLLALMWSVPPAWQVPLLAAGILGGAALRWGTQLAVLPRSVWRARADRVLLDQSLMRAFGMASAGSVVLLLAPLVVRSLASTIGPGAIASFNYAQKLVELPSTILITAIGTVALTKLSRLHAAGHGPRATRETVRDAQYALLVALSVLVPGWWFSEAVVGVIFGRGQMDGAALARIAELTRVSLLGLPLLAVSTMATAQLNASHRVGAVLKATLVALLCLPLLVLPGLLAKSEPWLMLAVVGFQAIAALLLARAAGLAWFGRGALLDPASWPYAGAALAAALAAVAADLLRPGSNVWCRLALAGAGFGVAMAFPVRRFLKLSAQSLD
jgi:putative peptidoglycan lipid II flippase